MSRISNHVVGLYERPAYMAGRDGYARGKHLIVPDEYRDGDLDREAWALGWNEEMRDQESRHEH